MRSKRSRRDHRVNSNRSIVRTLPSSACRLCWCMRLFLVLRRCPEIRRLLGAEGCIEGTKWAVWRAAPWVALWAGKTAAPRAARASSSTA
jgi:hypothetical protein